MIQLQCKAMGCNNPIHYENDFCPSCLEGFSRQSKPEQSMSQKYPKYYKAVGPHKEIDVYAVHQLFDIQDPSGCIQHASKKLLLSGCRTGGKTMYTDIREARDSLNRWLELNASTPAD
jgi:hypothetical protein